MASASDAGDAYRRFGPALVRKAQRMLGSRDDALDLVHGVFADIAAGRIDRMDLPYLFRSVTNRCLNQLRDHKNRRRLLEENRLAFPERTRAHEQLSNRQLLVQLLDDLDARSLEVLALRYFDDMTHDEIAQALGISRRAVVKRMTKIRRRASEAIAPRAEEAAS